MTSTAIPGTTPPPVHSHARVGGRRWEVLGWAIRRPRWFLGGLIKRVAEDALSRYAAALAYYFLFSLFPFLVALVTMLPFVQGLEDWLLAEVGQIVPGEAYTMIEGVIRSLLEQPRSGLLSLGAVLALWSASTAVTGLMGALNVAYGVNETR